MQCPTDKNTKRNCQSNLWESLRQIRKISKYLLFKSTKIKPSIYRNNIDNKLSLKFDDNEQVQTILRTRWFL